MTDSEPPLPEWAMTLLKLKVRLLESDLTAAMVTTAKESEGPR